MNIRDYYSGKRVLVTGGAGFIGSHLVEMLIEAGARVRVLDNLSQGFRENLQRVEGEVEFENGDIRDESRVGSVLDGSDAVFHLAANASVPLSVENPRYDFGCNAEGTLSLLCAMRVHPVSQCIIASSGAVYGEPTKQPIEETDPISPISPYGAAKAAAEALAHAFHASYDLPVRIARIFNTYGPRQPRFVMFDFLRKLNRDPRRLQILGNGRQIRDFCYVTDTVTALLLLGMIPAGPCEAFNVSSDVSHSVVEVAETMFRIMGLDDVDVSFTGTSWAGDAQRWEVSLEKIKHETGFRPAFDLDDGLRHFIEWFKAHPERII
jgi:UDP-glucose 4-epimerase